MMNTSSLTSFALCCTWWCLNTVLMAADSPSPRQLVYDAPGQHTNDALPLGNGRLGAMFLGGIQRERIQLNEASLWSGTGPAPVPPQGLAALPEIRRRLFANHLREAHDLAIATLPGPCTEAYQPVGDLILELDGEDTPVSGYQRALDLGRAIGTTSFVRAGVHHTREVLVSHPSQVVGVRWAVDRPGALTCRIHVESPQRSHIDARESGLVLTGQTPVHVAWLPDARAIYSDEPATGGLIFASQIAVSAPGATIVDEPTTAGHTLLVHGASELLIYSATRVAEITPSRDPARPQQAPGAQQLALSEQTRADIARAQAMSWSELRVAHEADHRSLFDRVQLTLTGPSATTLPLSLPERVARRGRGEIDPDLDALLFDYGRYLLIACSRPGSLPANLQGLWNREVMPPWWSNWTLNINTEMNYWPTEVCGLAELHQPLFDLIDRLQVTGAVVARELYGCHGWVAHHQTDRWASATPVGLISSKPNPGASRYALWPMGGAWITRHLWEHYLYTGDEAFLRSRAWPAMRGAAEFVLDFLVERPDGRLTTAPSTSPENAFLLDQPGDGPGKRFRAGIATGSTMDLSIIRDLFSNCLAAETALGDHDPAFATRLRAALDRLPPLVITASGRIAEWDQDYPESDPHHRHVSHLFGLHPGAQIIPGRTPELAAAARQTLEARGDAGTGWSLAWKINFWARLADADHAYRLITLFFNPVPADIVDLKHRGGIYPNLLCAHPPFQIDGNFGYTAGVAEMLIQSHIPTVPPGGFEIQLLPALPAAWAEGTVSGLRARGGITVAMHWSGGRLQSAVVQSITNQTVTIRYGERSVVVPLRAGIAQRLDSGLSCQNN